MVNFEPWDGIGDIVHIVMASWTQWEKRNEPYIMRLLSDPVSLALLRQLTPGADIAPVIEDYDRRHAQPSA